MKTTSGFIRVRKRKLYGRAHWVVSRRSKTGYVKRYDRAVPLPAASYDIVRAVRLNGKPTHKFVLTLGTLRQYSQTERTIEFWTGAVRRMAQHGLSKEQRKHFVLACVRKGAQLPTLADCKDFRASGWEKAHLREIKSLLATRNRA